MWVGGPTNKYGGIRHPQNCAPTLGYKNHTRECDPYPPMLPCPRDLTL